MGNSPSITGLDMGGAHGRRDIVRDGLRTEQRRARFQADESDIELAEELTDEYSGDESSVPESNRKSTVGNAPNPSFGYSIPLSTDVKYEYLELTHHAEYCSDFRVFLYLGTRRVFERVPG